MFVDFWVLQLIHARLQFLAGNVFHFIRLRLLADLATLSSECVPFVSGVGDFCDMSVFVSRPDYIVVRMAGHIC